MLSRADGPGPMRCASCGRENRSGARFCDACGTALPPGPAADAAARKIVTVVFADLIGSTSLHEHLDAESARRLMDRYYAALHEAVAGHGGTVVKLLGDGVLAAFGVPRVAEDDAVRAVRAAVAMQRSLPALGTDASGHGLGLRVAVNTGEVVVEGDRADVVGDPVNVAARLQSAARAGEVLVGEETRRLVADVVELAPFGALTFRGRSEPVRAYRVVSLEGTAAPPPTAFVGRDDELRRLTLVHEAALATRRARLAVVLGSPGLGKSRLLDELARRLGAGVAVLRARCDSAVGATLAPISTSLREFLRLDAGVSAATVRAAIEPLLPDDTERGRVADGVAALLADTPHSSEETFFVVRRLLAALATIRPVLVAIDDLQWAEPLLLDLIEHLIAWSADGPLVVVAAARPELRDLRPALAARGALVDDVVELAGLDATAATRLAASVLGAGTLPEPLAARVVATSEGNPLFVRELVRMLVHDGALARQGEQWITGVDLARLEMPPSIHGLLAARIERLRPDERVVLERAAVIGRRFSRAAVAQLVPEDARADLDARLEALRRSDLIEIDAGVTGDDTLLRFHHGLVRDAAYRRLLKETRAELHTRLADWLAARGAGAADSEETIGWHLERAYHHLRDLGPLDADGRRIGERAARRLGVAGHRALARDDVALAASLLGRAIDTLDADDATRGDLALDWCEALLAAGDVGHAARAIDELGRFARGSDRLRAWHVCFAGQRAALTAPETLHPTAGAVGGAAAELAAAGDLAGEAKARSVEAAILARLGQIGASESALDQALAAARRAGDRRRTNAVLAGVPVAALWGPSPVMHATGRCLDVVRLLGMGEGSPAVEAVALRCQGVLEALRGRTDAARRLIASARTMVVELGILQRVLEADLCAGLVELLAGDAPAAERWLRAAHRGLRDQGLAIDAAHAAALLARALLAQGRAGDAEALSHESESLAGSDLKAAIAWRGVRAEALARRGEHAAAVDLAGAAVDLAATTDALLDHADARRALAIALRAGGRENEAAAEDARAIELWRAKGATGCIARTPASVRHTRATGAGERAPAPTWRAAVENAASLAARAPDGGTTAELIATRGDRLALLRVHPDGDEPPGGPQATVRIELVEVDDTGRRIAGHAFRPDELDAAHAELDARYAAGDAAPYPQAGVLLAFCRAFATRDWTALATLLAPEIVVNDHRLLGWEPLRGPSAYVDAVRSLVDLAPDTRLRIDHVRMAEHGALCVTTWTGSREGGAFETPSVTVFRLDEHGRPRQFDQYEVEQLAEALRLLDAIG